MNHTKKTSPLQAIFLATFILNFTFFLCSPAFLFTLHFARGTGKETVLQLRAGFLPTVSGWRLSSFNQPFCSRMSFLYCINSL